MLQHASGVSVCHLACTGSVHRSAAAGSTNGAHGWVDPSRRMGAVGNEQHLEDDSEDLKAQQPDEVAGQLTVEVVACPCIPLEGDRCPHCLQAPYLYTPAPQSSVGQLG